MTLAEQLALVTREGDLYEPLEGNRIRCYACGHCCPIPSGFAGVCKVRFNRGGKLMVPYGYVNALHCDPIEKKPFFHALPGTRALSFGLLGCDLHCGYCQNWVSSQALRDVRSSLDFREISPAEIVRLALQQNASSIISTYNEPLITSEWAVAVFREARRAGLQTGYVSNGNATPQVLEYLRPWVDLYKVDLKSFDDRRPWHVTAFYPTYKMTGPGATTAGTLERAASIGRAAGLRYVYAGNLPGSVGGLENTHCPNCRAVLVERDGFEILQNRLTADGACPQCHSAIPGFWRPGAKPARAKLATIQEQCD